MKDTEKHVKSKKNKKPNRSSKTGLSGQAISTTSPGSSFLTYGKSKLKKIKFSKILILAGWKIHEVPSHL